MTSNESDILAVALLQVANALADAIQNIFSAAKVMHDEIFAL